jgi:hypothetical protein
MPETKLRLTRRSLEIKQALRSITPLCEVSAWIHPDDRRLTFLCDFISYEEEREQILIELRDPPLPELAAMDTLYFRFPKDTSVGKFHIISIQDRKISLQTCDEMLVSERRRHRRILFRSEDQKHLTLRMGDSDLELPVINASRSGFRVKTSTAEGVRLKASGSFQLALLGGEKMEIGCHFVWNDESSTGIELGQELSREVFENFSFTPRAKGIDAEKFFSDQEFYDTVKTNMIDIVKRLEAKPKLATAMQTLKLDREGNYLKNHTELLCYVSCSIGRMLGWVTQRTIDKLIYAAYLHDIRYFEKPELARIPSLQEFNKIKAGMTEEDQNVFLQGPEYSALMARDEEMNSMEVERILIQQKERPDGSGFPNGLDFKQLYPLSCLFMVCHEFVDYVYESEIWTFKDFCSIARERFKGPYFIKIIEAFDQLI